MFVDIYAIQNVPPCNINRDDTGTPKTAIYGGSLRSRVSSQAWKRAMRELFPSLVDEERLGVRTKRAVGLISRKIVGLAPELADKADEYAAVVLNSTGVKIEPSKRAGAEEGSPVTQYLIFISKAEIEKLATIAVKRVKAGEDLSGPTKDLKKEVSAAFHGAQALDIALFGRMLADAPDLNTDASAQVAHAISVDRVTQEYDYFTAIDDCADDDNAGAAMIETNGYNSSTLYRYATVNVDSLMKQLGDAEATSLGIGAFVEAFARSMPTGKQNSFANRTLPSAFVTSLRDDNPINGVSAFEVPLSTKDDASITHQAEERLAETLKSFEGTYGQKPRKAWWFAVDGGGDALRSYGEESGLKDMISAVEAEVLSYVSGEAK